MNKTAMKTLVDRFLTWPVPADVHPDGEPGKPGRTGTNLLNAVQAEQMLRYVLTADKPETDARKPYNIDADPDGIRALVCDAVRGALSFGFQGVNPPPEGHWLGEFWRMAQTSAQDPWSPSRESSDYDHSIHSNPDATAWAAFFVRTFPGLKDKEDLMVSWFANAMMAMHDHVKAQPAALVAEVADLQKQLEDTKQSLAFYKGRCDALQACQSTMRGTAKARLPPSDTPQRRSCRMGGSWCRWSRRGRCARPQWSLPTAMLFTRTLPQRR